MSNDINKMDVKQLRNEVQLLRDELAIMKRKYEDILYNLDTDNFSSRFVKEQGDMRTAIEVTAEGIKTSVEALSDADDKLSSEIKQTANSIQTTVSSVFNKITQVEDLDDMTDKSKIYTYAGENYHWNRIKKQWEKIAGNSIASSFIQTNDGFELKGDVAVSGDVIVGGTITSTDVISKSENKGEIEISEGHIQLWPDTYDVPLVDLTMWYKNQYWMPVMRFGRGTDASAEMGVGWIIKDKDSFMIEFDTSGGKSLYIEFDDSKETINIVGDVEFSGGTVSGLPEGSGGSSGGGSGSNVAVFGE